MPSLVETYKPRFRREQVVSERILQPGQTVILGTEQKGKETVMASLSVSSEDPRRASVEINHLRTDSIPSGTSFQNIEGRGTITFGRSIFAFKP